MQEVIAVIIVIAVAVLTDIVILGVAKILPKRKPSKLKYMRWEAGNIPIATPKYVLSMQYFGYLILFMALEPVVVLLFLFSAFPSVEVIKLFVISIIAFAPAIYFSFDYILKLASRRGYYG